MKFTWTHISLLVILTIMPFQFVIGNKASEPLKSQRDSISFIYYKTLEINKLLEEGERGLVIEKANTLIDSFPSFIIGTPYFGYLNYYKGSAYRSMGNYHLSEKHYRLANISFISNNDIETYISSQNNLSITLMESRKYDQAIGLLNKLLIDYPNSISKKNLSNIYGNLAALGLRMNDTALCNNSFNVLFQLNQGNSIGQYAYFITERNYGRYMLKQNNIEEAEYYLRLSLNGSIDSLGLNHFQTGLCLKHLGDLYSYTSRMDSAVHYYTKALEILDHNNEINNPEPKPQYETVLIECLQGYGEILVHMDNLENGLEMFRTAISRLQYLSHSITNESNRFIIAEKGRTVFNKAITTALGLYKNTGDHKYIEEAFEWSLQAKSFSLNWLAEKELIYKKLNIPEVLLKNLKVLRQNLDDGFPKLHSKNNLFYISQLLREYEKTEQIIRNNYPDINMEKQKLSFQNLLQASLGKNEKYLGYFDTGDQLVAFTIGSNAVSFKNITSEGNLAQLIDRFKETTTISPNANYTSSDIEEFSILSTELYKILVEPLIEAKDEILAIHPDGLLLGLSFEALTSKASIEDNFAELPYLFKTQEIRYVATPFLIEHPSKIKNDKVKLAIISCNNPRGARLIETESAEIHAIIPNSEIIHLDKMEFDPKALSDRKRIHISSHLTIGVNNPLGSGLSCSNNQGKRILTFSDILYLDLNGSQVFINACESGSGPLNEGEGLMSLGLAFALAGSTSIIQHQWEAPDHGAYKISLEYYKNLSKNNPAKSLNKAKLEYLENCSSGYDHPYYWAGIVCFGEKDLSKKLNFFYVFLVVICLAAFIAIILITRRLGHFC